MKKALAILLALIMLFAFAACTSPSPSTAPTDGGGGDATDPPADDATDPPADGEDPTDPPADVEPIDTSEFVELTWMYIGPGVTNDVSVMAKVNEILKEKLNCSLKMEWDGWGMEKAMPAINAGDPIDIYFTCSWTPNEYAAMARMGAFRRLDDPANNLIDRALADTWADLPSSLINGAMVDGKSGKGIYAVPTEKEVAQQYVWGFNKDILEKYGFSEADLTDLKGIEPILKAVKEGEGENFFPLSGDFVVLSRAMRSVDLVDSFNLLDYKFDGTNPANSGTEIRSAWETPEMKDYLTTMHEYYNAGYINPAATTNADAMNEAFTAGRESGNYAIEVYPYYPGFETTLKHNAGAKGVQAGISSTTSSRGAMNAISTASKNPERAAMLLNLVNTDAELRTLLGLGVEGEHYTKGADGKLVVTPDNGYAPWLAGMAKVDILPLTEGQPDNLYTELFPTFNDVQSVPIQGWALDQDPIKDQMAALSNVQAQYAIPLITGASDPAVELDKFISELKANGIDDVVAEANSQVAAFLAG